MAIIGLGIGIKKALASEDRRQTYRPVPRATTAIDCLPRSPSPFPRSLVLMSQHKIQSDRQNHPITGEIS